MAKGKSEQKAHYLEIMDKQKKINKNQKPQRDRPCLVYAFCPFQKNVSKLGLPSLKPNPINTLTENSEQLSPGHFLLMEITHPMPRSDLPSLDPVSILIYLL